MGLLAHEQSVASIEGVDFPRATTGTCTRHANSRATSGAAFLLPPMRNYLLLLSLLAPLTACVNPSSEEALEIDDQASSKADGALWYKLYTCNGGSAVLDVNG